MYKIVKSFLTYPKIKKDWRKENHLHTVFIPEFLKRKIGMLEHCIIIKIFSRGSLHVGFIMFIIMFIHSAN